MAEGGLEEREKKMHAAMLDCWYTQWHRETQPTLGDAKNKASSLDCTKYTTCHSKFTNQSE